MSRVSARACTASCAARASWCQRCAPDLTKTEFQSVSNTEGYQTSFPGFVWTTVEEVAAAGLSGVAKGRAVIVPGPLYKGLAAASGVTPRWLKRALSGTVQRG